MSTEAQEHNDLIRREFTRQAEAYAANPTIVDPDWARRLVQAVAPNPEAYVLDIATGPGYVALAFAQQVDRVIGVDLTAAPLAIADANRRARGQENVRFERADATELPYEDGTFDAVVCRLAFHHFADAGRVLAEMARVCRPGGAVAVEDLVASDRPDRAAYHNSWERLRDPSHAVALSVLDLVACFSRADLELVRLRSEDRRQVVEQWLRNAHTPADEAEEVRRLLRDDMAYGLSGVHIYPDETAALCFDHRMVTLVGVKR